MGAIDVFIVVAFIVYAVISGFRSKSKASKNLEEYFLAGRTLKGWKAGISMAATQFAADTPLLVTGLIATAGVFSLWRLWIYALAFLMMGFLLAGSWRRAGVITDAELTEIRYGKKPAAILRGVKAIYFGTIFNCAVLAMVLLAATRVAEPFLVWDQWLPAGLFAPIASLVEWIGVPLTLDVLGSEVWVKTANNLISIFAIVAVTTLYSTTGGLRSVVATDIVQFGIMMAGTLAYAWFVVDHAGGLSEMTDKIRTMFANGGPGGIMPDQILAMTPSQGFNITYPLLFAFGLQWLIQMNSDGTGYLAQRTMACRSDKDAKVAAVVFTFAQVFLRSLLWLPLGLGLLVVFPPDLSLPGEIIKAEREFTFVRGIAELLPVGVLGLMLTGMLAALASTVDTHLNWGSSYWTNDIFKRFICQSWLKKEPSGRALVWVARLSNILILMIALIVMSQLSSIQTAWQISLMLGAGMGIPLVLRWVWWRMNAWGEIAAILASLVLAPILMATVPAESEALRLLIIAFVSTGAALAATFIFGPESDEQLEEFYRRAHPPGFWRPVAAKVHEPSTGIGRFEWGLIAMLLCAFSLFCLLTGFASWLIDSPAPTWFPYRGAWITLLLVIGGGLIPLWWKIGFDFASLEHSLQHPDDESRIAKPLKPKTTG